MAQAKNTNTIPVIRYAEVLLNYAEAARELGSLHLRLEEHDWGAAGKSWNHEYCGTCFC